MTEGGSCLGIKGGKVEILRRMATSLLPAALLCLRPGGVILILKSLHPCCQIIEYCRPSRPTTPASSSCLSTPPSSSHLCSTQFPTRSPRHPLMGCQLKGPSAVGDVEEKEEPWMHQAMPQSRSASPCPMPFSLLSLNNLIE